MAKVKKKEPLKKGSKKQGAKDKSFRSFLDSDNKFKPVRELFNGFEIEKRWVVMTVEEDHSKKKNGLVIYNEVLETGQIYEQGYIKDMDIARTMLEELGIVLNEFRPNTVRLRRTPEMYILTLKDRKETKRREVEWELDRKTFMNYWKHTKGARVRKVRLEKEVKGGHLAVFDAFTDRFLLLAEIEVQDESMMKNLPNLGMDVTGQKPWTNKSLAK